MKNGKFYIDGKWIKGSKTINNINPSNGKSIGKIFKATNPEVDLAVNSASSALSKWKSYSIEKRCSIISKVADLLVEEYGEEGQATTLKLLISEEMGNSLIILHTKTKKIKFSRR